MSLFGSRSASVRSFSVMVLRSMFKIRMFAKCCTSCWNRVRWHFSCWSDDCTRRRMYHCTAQELMTWKRLQSSHCPRPLFWGEGMISFYRTHRNWTCSFLNTNDFSTNSWRPHVWYIRFNLYQCVFKGCCLSKLELFIFSSVKVWVAFIPGDLQFEAFENICGVDS